MDLRPIIGTDIPVHSYKHDGNIHRIWQKVRIVEATHNTIITASSKTNVIESDGRIWKTAEPAVSYFFDDFWFNVIAILRADGIHFYCNLSSPCLYNEDAIKYIDYDLDIKVFPNYRYKVLDEYEFNRHKKEMAYPEDVQSIIRSQMRRLINMINQKEGPFKPGFAKYWYDLYCRTR